jgi:hypothetical protein
MWLRLWRLQILLRMHLLPPATKWEAGGNPAPNFSRKRRDRGAICVHIRGAVKIVVEHVLRVRMVYVAIYLNIDYASG